MADKLTKRFRIIYNDDKKVIVYGEFPLDSETSKIHNAAEFDTETEMLQYIEDNGLIVENEDINEY